MINFSLKGRASVSDFLKTLFSVLIINTVLYLLIPLLSILNILHNQQTFYLHIINLCIAVLLILPTTVRRLHDRNKSGFYLMPIFLILGTASIIPIIFGFKIFLLLILSLINNIYGIYIFIQLLLPGDTDQNRFGENSNKLTNDQNKLEEKSTKKYGYGNLTILWLLYIPAAYVMFWFSALLLSTQAGQNRPSFSAVISVLFFLDILPFIIILIVSFYTIRVIKKSKEQSSQQLTTSINQIQGANQ